MLESIFEMGSQVSGEEGIWNENFRNMLNEEDIKRREVKNRDCWSDE